MVYFCHDQSYTIIIIVQIIIHSIYSSPILLFSSSFPSPAPSVPPSLSSPSYVCSTASDKKEQQSSCKTHCVHNLLEMSHSRVGTSCVHFSAITETFLMVKKCFKKSYWEFYVLKNHSWLFFSQASPKGGP